MLLPAEYAGILSSKVRSIEDDTHQASGECTNDRNSEYPSKEDPADGPPVDGVQISLAKTNTDCSASNAHGCGL